jgi:hypothetical protein
MQTVVSDGVMPPFHGTPQSEKAKGSVLGSWYLQQPNASAWVHTYGYGFAGRMTSLTSLFIC